MFQGRAENARWTAPPGPLSSLWKFIGVGVGEYGIPWGGKKEPVIVPTQEDRIVGIRQSAEGIDFLK